MKTILAPDPNPIKPQYVPPPPGACDAHCHVFGPGAKFPYAPDRSYTPPDAPKEQLAALHKHLGFSRAVLVQASCHGIDNAAVVDALNSSQGAWRGVCMINDLVTDGELRTLHAAGVRGARFNFVAHLGGAPDLRVIESVVKRIKPSGLASAGASRRAGHRRVPRFPSRARHRVHHRPHGPRRREERARAAAVQAAARPDEGRARVG